MVEFDTNKGKLFRCNVPPYPDHDSRIAYLAGYSDGWHGYEREPGDWPVQPYSQGYWTGRDDVERD